VKKHRHFYMIVTISSIKNLLSKAKRMCVNAENLLILTFCFPAQSLASNNAALPEILTLQYAATIRYNAARNGTVIYCKRKVNYNSLHIYAEHSHNSLSNKYIE
jgi:uncharacterized membrane protein